MNLCKYSQILGKVGEGVHRYRLFDFAIVDVLFTFVLAFIVTLFIRHILKKSIEYWKVLIGCFISGILAHYIFCVDTKLNTLIFNT